MSDRVLTPKLVSDIRDLFEKINRTGVVPDGGLAPSAVAGFLDVLRTLVTSPVSEGPTRVRFRLELVERMAPVRNVPAEQIARESRKLAEMAGIGGHTFYSEFQLEAWRAMWEAMETASRGQPSGVAITAPTGGGKTEAFLLPVVFRIADAITRGEQDVPRFVLVYPRRALVQDQLRRVLRYVRQAERMMLSNGRRIVVGLQFGGIWSDTSSTLSDRNVFAEKRWFLLADRCPWCGWRGYRGQTLEHVAVEGGLSSLRCIRCRESVLMSLSKRCHVSCMPHILLTTVESLDRMTIDPQFAPYLSSLHGLVLDEAHLYHGVYGAHVSRLLERMRRGIWRPAGRAPVMAAVSATMPDPGGFAGSLLFAGSPPDELLRVVSAADSPAELFALEVLCLLQVNERALVAATAQVAEALAKGMLGDGGRMLVFTDSLEDARRIARRLDRALRPKEEGAHRLRVQSITGRTHGSRAFYADVIVGTSALEVGIDDPAVRITVHHHAPPTVFEAGQRRGRAGRAPNEIAYTAIVVGERPEDEFHLFNPHRLISGEYRLPLNPDNPVAVEAHRLLEEARARIQQLSARLSKNGEAEKAGVLLLWTLETLQKCPYLRRHSKWLHIAGRLRPEKGWGVLRKWVEEEREKASFAARCFQRVVEVEERIRDEGVRRLFRPVSDILRGWLRGEVGEQELHAVLKVLQSREGALQMLLMTQSARESRAVHEDLQLLDDFQREAAEWVKRGTGGGMRDGTAWQEFFDEMHRFFSDPKARNIPSEAVRIVYRALFFLHEALGHHRCQADVSVYIPDAYFEDVRPVHVQVLRREGASETHADPVFYLDGILMPFRPLGRYGTNHPCFLAGEVRHVKRGQPDEEIPPDYLGAVVFSPEAFGKEIDDPEDPAGRLLRVRRLLVREVFADEDDAVGVCTRCFELLEFNPAVRDCPKCRARDSVVYGTPFVKETYTDSGLTESAPPVTVGDRFELLPRVRMWTRVRGCRIGIDELTFDVILEKPFYFDVQTSAIRWRLQPDAVSERPLSRIVLDSAAALLQRTIAAVCGVQERQLARSVDEIDGTVTVCELFDGGAGISQLFADILRSDPLRVYREMVSIVACPVYWADMRGLAWDDEAELAAILSKAFGLSPDDPLIRRVVSESVKESSREGRRPTCSEQGSCPACVELSRKHLHGNRPVLPSRNHAELLVRSLIRRVPCGEQAMGGLQGVAVWDDPHNNARVLLIL